MNDQHELSDTLVDIQQEIDQAVGLINEAIIHGHHELRVIAQLLQAVHEPIASAQDLLRACPAAPKPTKPAQVRKFQPKTQNRVVPPPRNWPTTTCRICKASVYQHDLESHLIRVHQHAAPLVLPPKPKKQPKAKQPSKPQSATPVISSKATPKRQGAISDALLGAGSPAASTKQYEICPVCKDRVRQDRLNKHLSRVHPQAVRIPAYPPSRATQFEQSRSASAKKSKTKTYSSVSAKSQAYLPTSDSSNELPLEALDQSYRDRRDGGKELSQSRRDHGQFGSMPVYDDYSEDSYS